MISISKSDNCKIFLTSTTQIDSLDKKADIIVSPEFYWVRIFHIPVKTEKQAKTLLPVLFEEVIDIEESLTYKAIKKSENTYLCFAYDEGEIFKAIKNAKIQTSNIGSIYFAQNECQAFEKFQIDNQTFIYTEDDILVKVPPSYVEHAQNLSNKLEDLELSSHKFNIKLHQSLISSKNLNLIFIALFLIFTANIIKYFSYSSSISEIETKIENLTSNNNLPSSFLQLQSIYDNSKKNIETELKKREALAYILQNNQYDLKSIRLSGNKINLEYYSSKNKRKIKKLLQKKFKAVSIQQSVSSLKVRVSYE